MKHPLRKKEVDRIYEALLNFRQNYCVVREGMVVDEEDAYICRDCPFNDHGDCKLKIWVHKHGFNI